MGRLLPVSRISARSASSLNPSKHLTFERADFLSWKQQQTPPHKKTQPLFTRTLRFFFQALSGLPINTPADAASSCQSRPQ
jgi:hypothetical protein